MVKPWYYSGEENSLDPIHFPSMVHFVKPIIDYATGIKKMPEGFFEKHPSYRLLFQDQELASLASELLELIPFPDNNIKYDSKSIQPQPLEQMVAKMEDVRRKWTPDSQASTSLSQKDAKKIQLWNFVCTIQNQFASKPWHYDYCDLVIDNFYRVTFIPKIRLLRCNVSYDDIKIYLNAEWSGPFKQVEFITIPGTTQSFWSVTCNGDDTSLYLNVMRYFLYMQVAAGWGENMWLAGEIKPDGNFTATLQLLRVDASPPPKELPWCETIADKVSDYVVRHYYPSHFEVSEELEVKLREELERRQQYMAQGLLEDKFADQINQWIDELVAYRNAYHREVSANQR
jgi:hypothetical protein